ncbi:dTDP-4-dehydrorhamnose 3,5-epimerase [Pseudoduganella albidiflava]|uniref:dTDP-4-dehydrorhamnose 3,5-epimerase n=1 Tax=Pseudoduganella albidiflava TaxID=321983 RepID=A0A411X6L2_9BURK|nr:dTDP-4-dehydrorhamnose 3,5-epimerase [Pseudoduganella albidiflava]QBI04647.1 dTDP-4-dehydrorhamnose 3,5-epimerase [Pseudoduganella albidiflava]GGY28925.1 dTDP-4-dehydrorhamnose 3,5-epimerase [Pseudoduganella albidiflava]
MDILPTSIPGCFELRPIVRRDERGSFTKVFHEDVFRDAGLRTDFAEEYYSISQQGVLRGLHFQVPPHDHAKLVYCPQGRVLDAALDLRRGSPTYGRHLALELSGEAGNMLYLPAGLAHGFYTLSEQALMVYKVTSTYAPAHDGGVLWNSAGIDWPDSAPLLSPRDRTFPTLADFDSPFAA